MNTGHTTYQVVPELIHPRNNTAFRVSKFVSDYSVRPCQSETSELAHHKLSNPLMVVLLIHLGEILQSFARFFGGFFLGRGTPKTLPRKASPLPQTPYLVFFCTTSPNPFGSWDRGTRRVPAKSQATDCQRCSARRKRLRGAQELRSSILVFRWLRVKLLGPPRSCPFIISFLGGWFIQKKGPAYICLHTADEQPEAPRRSKTKWNQVFQRGPGSFHVRLGEGKKTLFYLGFKGNPSPENMGAIVFSRPCQGRTSPSQTKAPSFRRA